MRPTDTPMLHASLAEQKHRKTVQIDIKTSPHSLKYDVKIKQKMWQLRCTAIMSTPNVARVLLRFH